MGRLDGVRDMKLKLPQLCAEFYVLEMAVNHIPDGPAAPLFERYQRNIAPKIALTLEYSISTELGYAKGVPSADAKARYGDDCPSCVGEYFLEACDGWEGCGEKHGFLYCPGCEIHFFNGEAWGKKSTGRYPESMKYFRKQHGMYDSEEAYNRTFETYGLQFLADNSKVFHNGHWTPGYGGKKWGTIADVVRDYWHGDIKPRTFLDRAWTLQHNNASVFDKLYSINKLMRVLEIQAENDYETLVTYTEPYVANMFRRMQRWVDVYTVDLGGYRGIRPGTGSGD